MHPEQPETERRRPFVLSELNRRTTARWQSCTHRYTDETVWRNVDGWELELHVCRRCRVPVVLVDTRRLSKALILIASARKGSVKGGLSSMEKRARERELNTNRQRERYQTDPEYRQRRLDNKRRYRARKKAAAA